MAQGAVSTVEPTSTTISQVKKGKSLTRGSGSLPFPREQLRQELLEKAGFTQEEQRKLLMEAIEQLTKALNAKETKILSHQGALTKKIHLINWGARLEAVQKSFDLLDVVRGKSEGGGGAQVKFEIVMPHWDAPQPEVKVIESEGKILDDAE